ncbi:hypothetical protein [Nonlabens ponticola]|uniref:Uncharacterized protein n=1 Tax=Nonlabens ponticola TaxID=2496866 RepID=A0A3S9MXR0_9FLAO|nr:hypothetical protein [Nonlabens ponticola]AZQ43924.1 hypothetical protein EJ995_06640 [Nonlabens ponticola]
MKTQKSIYNAKDITYASLIAEDENFTIENETKYALKSIQDYDVPKRIRILSEFIDDCNVNDTIIQVNAIGKIQNSQFWFIKKDDADPVGFIRL